MPKQWNPLLRLAVERIVSFMVEKVGYTRPTSATRNVRKAAAAGGAEFAEALSKAEAAAGVGGVEATQSVAAVSGVGSLLGAQEVSEEEHRRRQYVKRGRLTLEALARLRDGLLSGSLPLSTLQSLQRLVTEERALTTDLGLNAILDEIELRAAVEIAKLEVAGVLPRV